MEEAKRELATVEAAAAAASVEAATVAASADVDAAILRTHGQRWTNRLWEVTQATIAISVVLIALVVAAIVALWTLRMEGEGALASQTAALGLLSNSLFLVIGFYFGRTNHQRTGGVGAQDTGR